jgi:hypothetical protein
MYFEFEKVENSPANMNAVGNIMQKAHFKYIQYLQFIMNLKNQEERPTITPITSPATFSTKSIPMA